MTTLLPLLLMLAGTPSLTGCAGVNVANELQVDSQDQAAVGKAAETWWRDVRWQRSASAKAYIEDSEDRTAFVFWIEDQKETRRITEATVLDVQLGEPLVPPVDGREREATVLVKVEAHELPAMTSANEKVSQTWYRTKSGWFVEWSPDEDEASEE